MALKATLEHVGNVMLDKEVLKRLPIFIPVALALFCVAWVIYQRVFSPLAKVPGPFSASISPYWKANLAKNGGQYKLLPAIHKKYGPYVRTGPNEVSVTDPDTFKTIYSASSKFRKSDYYSVWQGRRKFDMLAERDHSIYSANRKIVGTSYSMSYMKSLEAFVDATIDNFSRKLTEKKGQKIDFGNWIQFFAFDVIGEVTFSKRFGYVDAEKDFDGSFDVVSRITRSGGWIGQVPWLYWIHDFLQPVIGNWMDINMRNSGIREFTQKEVEARRGREDDGESHDDILSKLWSQHEAKPEQYEESSITAMCMHNIVAGSETTATTIRAIFYYLTKNPDCFNKLCDEIREWKESGELTDPVSFEVAQKMPYLQAVITEASRLFPALGQIYLRKVPESGLDIGITFLPQGVDVGTSPCALHRNEDIFGDDCDSFNPERWMGDKGKKLNPFFFSFSGGNRTCLGKNIAWMEMSKLVPTMLQRFTFELISDDLQVDDRGMMVTQTGFYAKLYPREQPL